MSENRRKCFKCGASPSVDCEVVLYRFPKPGMRSTLRSELWASYCFPKEGSFSLEFLKKMYSEHKMLCHKHFKKNAFADYNAKKLYRDAVPHQDCDKARSDIDEAGPSYLVDVTNQQNVLQQYPGPSKAVKVLPVLACTDKLKVGQTTPATNIGLLEQSIVSHSTSQQSQVNMVNILDKNQTKQRKLFLKCRKYMKKICYLRNSVTKIKNQHILQILNDDNSIKSLGKYLTPTFALLLQAQLRNCKKKSTGRRWTMDDKIIALRLFKRSPTCYRLLKRLFCLPAQSTLKTLLKEFQLPVGANVNVLSIIKKYVIKCQKPSDAEFVLMFDEMSIKKNLQYNVKDDVIDGYQDHGAFHGRSSLEATHALVFMIAGLRKKLKQPIAYYLSSSYVTADRTAVLIKEVIEQCFNFNISISAIICDMAGVNRRALNSLGASHEQPYIICRDKEIITLFDTPHLLKCFRNLFLKYDIECMVNISSSDKGGIGKAKWSHIEEFFKLDNSNPNFVFAPSLKKDHLSPNAKQKMKVKLAAQVLSHTVAAGMYAKISQGELSSEALATADVINNIDRLFDCLNSDSPDLRRGKPHATNMSLHSPHLNFFKKMKLFFQNLKFLNCRQTPPSQMGWIWTMNGVERLWRHIINKHKDVKSLATRRLQQDPLENFFGCVRANCGANCNPNVKQFVAATKTAILSNLAYVSEGNCQNDNNDAIIENFKCLISSKEKSTDINLTQNASGEELVSQMLSSAEGCLEESICDDSGEIQACAYVCGFLIKRIFQKNATCNLCNNIFSTTEESLSHTFTKFKEYNSLKNSLKYASKSFVECVEKCTTLANKELIEYAHENNLKQKIVQIVLNNVNFMFLEECCEHYNYNKIYIVNSVFHICVKRFCIIKNRMYAEEPTATSLKRKIEILRHK